jgi:hypothetical protein
MRKLARVFALGVALAGCGGGGGPHTLSVELDADPGVMNARYTVWQQVGQALQLVATRSASDRFASLQGTIFVQSMADVGTGELERVALAADTSIAIRARLPQLDSAKAVTASAGAGSTTGMVSLDDGGDIVWRLFALDFSFPSSSTITLTPLGSPLLDFANSNGVQLSFSTPPSGSVFLEASGVLLQTTLLVTWDGSVNDWVPIPGAMDDGGVRIYPINAPGVYSEVFATPVAGQPPPLSGVDEYEAFDLLKGDAAGTLAWIEANHLDGTDLTDEEKARLADEASQIQALADAILDHACTEGADWGELRLAFDSQKVGQSLGGDSQDFSTRLDDAMKRCLGQILARGDCSQAVASGDVVLIEVQRQLLHHAQQIAAGLGDADAEQEIEDDLANCTPGDASFCMPTAPLPDSPPSSTTNGGDPAVYESCGSLCASECSNSWVDWDCDDAMMIAAENQRCFHDAALFNTLNTGLFICGVTFWVEPDPDYPGECRLWCETKGFADHAADTACHRL